MAISLASGNGGGISIGIAVQSVVIHVKADKRFTWKAAIMGKIK